MGRYFPERNWVVVLGLAVAGVLGYAIRDMQEPHVERRMVETPVPQEEAEAPQEEEEAPGATPPSAPVVISSPTMTVGASSDNDRLAVPRTGTNANLGLFHQAQRVFHGATGRYSTDLRAIRWTPPGPLMRFKLGFLVPSTGGGTAEDPNRMDTGTFLRVVEPSTGAPYVYTPEAQAIDLGLYSDLCRRGCTADSQGYEVMVAVPLNAQGNVDVWLFNHRNELVHVWDGLGNQRLD